MILHQLTLFLIGLGFGIICRFIYVFLSFVERKINLFAITIILDIFLAAAVIISFTLILFFATSGVFTFFILIAAIIGFTAASLLL